MNSIKIQVPFDYNYLELCDPPKIRYKEGISEILTGSSQVYTNYKLIINKNQTCQVSCKKTFSDTDVRVYEWLIKRNYTLNFFLDSLPAGRNMTNPFNKFRGIMYNRGIPIGFNHNNTYFLFNHYNIFVDLHEKNGKYQVVGFIIEPASVQYDGNCENNFAPENFNKDFQILDAKEITYTYNVNFRPSNTTFASRWDHYLGRRRGIHWAGLITSNILIFIFSFLVFFILSRAIKKDIEIYNRKVIADEIINEFGWKQVCNDVFRRPKNLMLLSAAAGTGVEIFLMLIQSLFFSVIGFATPEYRGGLINVMVILFCFMGFPAGFVGAFVYKSNGGKAWLKSSLLTAVLFPVTSLLVLFIVRIMFSFEKSPSGLKLSEMVILIVLWMCISIPLTLLGALVSIRRKQIKYPCKVNVVPSQLLPKPWYLKVKYTIFFTGIIPFATIFIEFIYIMAAMWKHQVYFLASFVGFSVLFIVISSAEISIIFVYLNLCKGDYNWWWKSFFVSSSPCLYIMGYSIYYFFFLNITRFSAIVIYFSLMALISISVGLACGGCGVLLTFGFLYYIYSKIKID